MDFLKHNGKSYFTEVDYELKPIHQKQYGEGS